MNVMCLPLISELLSRFSFTHLVMDPQNSKFALHEAAREGRSRYIFDRNGMMLTIYSSANCRVPSQRECHVRFKYRVLPQPRGSHKLEFAATFTLLPHYDI